ncbi:MAG: thiamine diphosphokinase [Candidatus Hydrothermota bacterium]|nr:MAG: thiamine diphosphokinase [Candidatus Hydrothermae bacterium]
MKVLIVNNGQIDEKFVKTIVERHDTVIAVSEALKKLMDLGIMPQIAVGNFKFMPQEDVDELESKGLQFFKFPLHKDKTDVEIAVLKANEMGAYEISLTGTVGTRIDHQLASFQLLAHPDISVPLKIVEPRFEAFAVRNRIVFDTEPGNLISLIPLSDEVTDIWTDGLSQNLYGERLICGLSRGISNKAVSPTVEIAIGRGILLVIHFLKRQE